MRFVILLLLIAGACSRTETSEPVAQTPEAAADEAAESAEEAPPEQPPEAAATQDAPQEGAPPVELKHLDALPTVELLGAGKAPRKALRATFEAGAKQSLRVESDWSVETVYGPLLQIKSVMPSLVYVLQTEVKETTKERARFDFRVSKVTAKASSAVKPEQAKGVKNAAGSLEGATGSFSINARGLLQEFTIDAPTDASLLVSDMIDQIKQSLRLCSLPLPEEPVGKGAKWTATQVIEQRTAKIKQTSTFELVGMKGEVVRARSTHVAEAPGQRLVLPGSREGTSLKLDKVEVSGESKGAWPLNQLGPKSASEHMLSVLGMTATKRRRESVIMAVETTLEVKTQR